MTWWHHQMETFSALLALCAGNSPVTGEFPLQRPVTWSFDVFFDLQLNKRLSKQSRCWWYEMPPCSLRPHCNDLGPLLLTGIIFDERNYFALIPAWKSNYINCKVWDEIIHPFTDFNNAASEVWKLISNFIPCFTGHVITYMMIHAGIYVNPYK